VRNGLGISFLQRISIKDELESGKLVELPLHHSIPSTPIYLIFGASVPEYVRNIVIQASRRLFPKFAKRKKTAD